MFSLLKLTTFLLLFINFLNATSSGLGTELKSSGEPKKQESYTPTSIDNLTNFEKISILVLIVSSCGVIYIYFYIVEEKQSEFPTEEQTSAEQIMTPRETGTLEEIVQPEKTEEVVNPETEQEIKEELKTVLEEGENVGLGPTTIK